MGEVSGRTPQHTRLQASSGSGSEGGFVANIITGTGNGESLDGTAGDDEITALGGSDAITVSRGRDSVDGGDDYDLLHLHASGLALGAGPHQYTISADRLFDASGALDTTFTSIEALQLTDDTPSDVTLDASGWSGMLLNVGVQAGTHDLIGSAGGDTFGVNGGSGTIDGGAGSDWVAFNVDTGANAAAIVASMAGGAIILAQAGGPSLSVRNVERIGFGAYGGGALSVDGSALSAALLFTQTNLADTFIGGSGNDSLTGSWTATGTGDLLTGGGGADNFAFVTFAAFGGATITDLSEQDVISLSSTPDAVRFIGTAAFSGTAGEVRYVRGATQTLLIGDADGDGIGESTLTLSGSFQIAADFTRPWNLMRIPDVITGTGGNDTIKAGAGVQTIQTLGGDDNIDLNRGQYVVDGGAGLDRLYVHSFPLGLPAGPHRYTITDGTLADDKGRVDASLSSIEMVFLIDVSTDDVTVDASALTGIALNLTLSTGSHDVKSGAGADQISVRGGSGAFDGGGGNDWLWVELDNSANANVLRVTETGGVTTLSQIGRPDVTARNFETLDLVATGGAMLADASAIGRAVNFQSTAFADTIIGSAGNNHFYSIPGGGGTGDLFTGSGGADWYDFYSFAALAGATITDFSADDQIDLHLISSARFIGTAAFSGTAGEIRYVASGGQTQLIGDGDGDGVGESVLTLSNREMALRETSAGSKYLQMVVNSISGTSAGETISGTAGDDLISALGGPDTIRVSLGYDMVDGGLATDTLAIDASAFDLGAAPHSYVISAGHVTGGAGAIDTSFTAIERVRLLDIGGSNVTLDASALTGATLTATVQAGTHNLIGSAGADNFSVGGGSGTVDAGGGIDMVAFTTDNNLNANPVMITQSGAATVMTQAGGPSLSVTNTETILIGARAGSGLHVDASASGVGLTFSLGAFADRVRGGTGNDIFTFGIGATGQGDILTGGGGADSYSLTGLAAYNGATITDLAADDEIRLAGLPFGAQFIGRADFTGVAGQYGYYSSSGVTALLADIDGDGNADSAMLISNGAFVLAETSPGVLRIVGQMPANDMEDNVVTGTDGTDYIDTGSGNDTIDGRGGNDHLNADEGDDHVVGGAGSDMIHGGEGNDTIDGGADTDSVFGDDGDDILTGTGHPSDTDPGYLGRDWIGGGAGNDTITGTNGAFALFGDEGDDRITLNRGRDNSWIEGGAGNDVIVADGTGAITIGGNIGDDDITLAGFTGGNVMLGTGNDVLRIVSGGGYLLNMAETFGTGHDRVVVGSQVTGLTVQGFSPGEAGDVLDLSAFGADPFGTGALAFSRNGPDSYITVAATGARIIFQGVNYADLSAYNLGVPNPYFAPIGQTLNDAFAEQPTIDWASSLFGADGNDTINGFGGDDWLYGSGGADGLHGGDGGDYLDGGSGADVLHGGVGDDVLAGGTGNDVLMGEAGTDTASYAGATDGVSVDLSRAQPQDTGGAGVDTLTGIENLAGSVHADVLTGDGGANALTGNDGQDWLIGGGGGDVQTGDAGNDSVWGGDGDDLLVGGAGDDTIAGGSGIDTASYAMAEAGVEINLSILEDQLTRGAGTDTLISIENVIGSAFDDVLAGDSGANRLTGGAGNDRFVFGEVSRGVRDTIADFTAGDLIDLSFIDANGALAGDAAFAFIGASGFGGTAGQLRVTGSGTSWLVEGDLNGDRVADFGIAVTTSAGGLGLAGSDFLL